MSENRDCRLLKGKHQLPLSALPSPTTLPERAAFSLLTGQTNERGYVTIPHTPEFETDMCVALKRYLEFIAAATQYALDTYLSDDMMPHDEMRRILRSIHDESRKKPVLVYVDYSYANCAGHGQTNKSSIVTNTRDLERPMLIDNEFKFDDGVLLVSEAEVGVKAGQIVRTLASSDVNPNVFWDIELDRAKA